MVDSTVDLESLQKSFHCNAVLAHQRLREFRADNHPEFLKQSVSFLRRGEDGGFSQLVIQLLRDDGKSLNQLLFDPSQFTVDEAARVVRMVSKTDPSFPVHFTSQVKTEIDKAGSGVRSEDLARLLEILVLAIDANRLLPLLGNLCNHDDERIRSKAVLLAGRIARRFQKGLDLLRDLDPRVRANAVEALWGKRDEETIKFFREAAKDPHHRVSANALFGLYSAGEIGSVPSIVRMVTGSEGIEQLAGVWLLQKTADPRFLPLIQSLLAVSTGRVKTALLKAGRMIKQRREDLLKLPFLDLDLVHFERKEKGRVRLAFTVTDVDGNVLDGEKVVGTAIQIHDGNLRVDAFKLSVMGSSREMAIAYLIPMRTGVTSNFAIQLVSAMELALSVKRRADVSSISRYSFDQSEKHAPNVPADFVDRTDVLRSDQLRSTRCQFASLQQSFDQMLLNFPGGIESKHWVIIRDPELKETIDIPAAVFERAVRFGITIHVVTCSPMSEDERNQWYQLCNSTNGYLIECESVAELPFVMRSISQGLQSRFEVTYQLGRIGGTADQGESITIELYTDIGVGRVAVGPDGHVLQEQSPPVRLDDD